MSEVELTYGNLDNGKMVKKGEFLFKEGDKLENIYLIKKGEVALFKLNEKRIIPVDYVSKKGIIGDDIVYNDSVAYYNALVMEDTDLVELEQKEIEKFLNLKEDWISDLLKNISEKIKTTMNVVTENRIVEESLFGDNLFDDEIERQIRVLLK